MFRFFLVSIVFVALNFMASAQSVKYDAYLFVYFTGNDAGEEAIRYAISRDGFTYKALNNNKPVIASDAIAASGGVRDPHVLRSHDGKSFYMTVTDLKTSTMGWSNQALVLLKSNDLIHWSSAKLNIPKLYPEFKDVNRVWAPQTIYDPQNQKYIVYFSMRTQQEPDKLYYAYVNDTFTAFISAPKPLFNHPANAACIDPDIVYDAKTKLYHLFFKDAGKSDGIKQATSQTLTGDYTWIDKRVELTDEKVEGSGIFPLNDGKTWLLMYDVYMKGGYEFIETTDLVNFRPTTKKVNMNFKPRHGSVLPITRQEYSKLFNQYYRLSDVFLSAQSKRIKTNNIVCNDSLKLVSLPVKPGTDLAALDPAFVSTEPDVKIYPAGKADFSKGPVEYTIATSGRKTKYKVEARVAGNPVLDRYYADPDILYSFNKKKFYIYPTSDGFHGWSGTYFKVFSSDDLTEWKDEGVILDLKKDVPWGSRNAWAPTAIERSINGKYSYFFYFTAAQKIGVATADNPTGPFRDSGKPLIDFKPTGITNGQEIDPMVFADPLTKKYYLYWGNGYLAAAELNDDMISIKRETLTVMTPDETFREGTYVFVRKGIYYFLWSEDDTRSPNYKVRYATASSPMGPLKIEKDNIVVRKNIAAEIHGTGHNSVINVPGTDEWYLVYHRFSHPKGIDMGRSAGFHREVCIDVMKFDEQGKIIEVIPTLKGIAR
jgi:arabinoxylan arabinofuranohydrolase